MGKNMRTVLDSMFNPRAVAVIGSVKEGKIAHQIITQLRAGGYTGGYEAACSEDAGREAIWAVNPKGLSPARPDHPEMTGQFPDISNIPGAASVSEIPVPVDLAVVCSPAPTVAGVLEECGAKGIPAAVIITSGFGEIGRRKEEEKLLEIARRYGIRLIGPNCAGIMNPGAGLFASIEVRALPGSVAFLTQSGAVGGAVLAMAEERGIGFSIFVSYGNRIDIGETELLEYLAEDDATTAAAVYIESLGNGRAFMEKARNLTKRKPLIMIKAGRTDAGTRAAGSHTGALAGSDRVFDTMIREIGALRVSGLEEMLDLCQGFSLWPETRGKKVAIVTNSGGPGILAADRAEELGLEVSVPERETASALKNFLPGHASVSNPVDLTVEGTGPNYSRALEVLLSGNYDSAIAINVGTPFLDSAQIARGIIEAAENTGKPIGAVFMAGRIVKTGLRSLREHSIATFPTGERAAAVIAGMEKYRAFRRSAHTPGGPDGREPAAAKEASGKSVKHRTRLKAPVLMPEAFDLLSTCGFTLPRYRFLASDDQSRSGSRANHADPSSGLQFPLAMKVVSPSIIHKSDAGGVILNLQNQEEVQTAYLRMQENLGHRDFRGVLLHEMIPQGAEIILGIKRDPTFGPVLAVGAGGIYTEILRDVSLRIAPVDRKTAEEQLRELKIYPLLTGFRNTLKLDIDDLIRQMVLLSNLALEHPEIRELDLNPLFVLEKKALVGDIHIEIDR